MNDEVVTSNDNEAGGDLLSSLVGDGKKFRTAEDLAKGKMEADSFINKLKEENQALRSLIQNQEDTSRSTKIMEDLLNRVSKSTLGREETAATMPTEQPRNQSESLTSRDVADIFRVMKKQEAEETNLTKALSRVREKYQDKTEEHLKAKADELGLELDHLMATAKRSPTAFMNLIGENNNSAQASATGTVKGSVNSVAVVNGQHGAVRNRAYYDKVKAEIGIRAFVMDAKLQNQLHKDMQALGDAWDE